MSHSKAKKLLVSAIAIIAALSIVGSVFVGFF